MEPRIQYAKTEDGVNIAYYSIGEGPSLVNMTTELQSHAQLSWQQPELRAWGERLGRHRKLIGYDHRGTGMSDRTISDWSMEARLLDLEAVTERLGLERFALFGAGEWPAWVSTAYAVRHPERVSHLILFCAVTRRSDMPRGEHHETWRSLARQDWKIFTEAIAASARETSDLEQARRVAELMRESMTSEDFVASREAGREVDVTALLPSIRTPTLVIERRDRVPPEVPRAITSQIADAELVILEGSAPGIWAGDIADVCQAVHEFLGATEATTESSAHGGFATILFTDMEGSTTLADRLGDAAAQDVRRAHNEIVRAAIGERDGREIKHTGDGIMASFTSASFALECSIAIQQGVAAHRDKHPDSPLGVYVGLNAGEPIAEDDDLFGTAVDLAARLVDHAQPGQIIASDVVRQLAAGKDFLFSDLGETELRGFEDPVKLWEVRWNEDR